MIRQCNRLAWLAATVFLATSGPARAADDSVATETPADHSAAIVLPPVTVLGTRTERPTDAVPRSVDVVGADEIAHRQSPDLGAVVAPLPNISLTGSPRPSAETIQIRGLSGDRVLLLVDGVRQGFNKNHLGSAFIEPGLIERVEIQRGPASVLWGSGALGGVVSVETKDAADLLAAEDTFGARLSGGHQSASDGAFGSATAYGRPGENLDALLYVSRRDHDDLELADGETLPHSAYQRDAALAKTTWYLAPGQSIELSHRALRLEGETPSNPAGTISGTNPVVEREIARDTTQVDYRLMPRTRLVDLRAQVYHSQIEVAELAADLGRRDRTTVERVGLDLANTSRFDLGGLGDHALTYGIDGFRDRAEATRDGQPRTTSPDGQRRLLGAYVQDVIALGDWTITPGLRYDDYRSESEDGVAPEQEESATSAQLGVLWQTTEWLGLYASYAEAFRAPSLTEMYATGTHFGANTFQPNPNLKPEKAASKEVGLRTDWQGLWAPDDRLRFEVTAFRNDVEDFIELNVDVQPLPFPPFVGGTTTSENVTEARLEGFEATAFYGTDAWFVGLAHGHTRGYNETEDEPLAGVAPDTTTLRLGLTALPWNGRITWRTTHATAQERVPAGTLETGNYTVHALYTTWRPSRSLRLDLGVANITDEDYRRHNSVIPEAGRNITASATWRF